MIKKISLVLGLAIAALSGTSQHICWTDEYHQELIKNNPALAQQLQEVWEVSDGPLKEGRNSRAVDIVPVVVHVIHDNGVGNIAYDQIVDGIDVLNEDFSRTNADALSTRQVFQNVAANSEIEFRLAKIDPNGDCTNGVVRVNAGDLAYDARNNVKSLSFWPSDQYMNIWLVESIQGSGGPGIVLGFAQFPGFGSWNTYGVVQRNDRWGRIGTSNSDGRTATHELGHCFNLLHTFQNGCAGSCNSSGDRVCDTPPTSQATYNCNLAQNTCSNDASGPSSFNSNVVDQIENYMSYDDCQNMFSQGQKARMKNALNVVPQLINLTSQANLVATGVDNPQGVLCKADFDLDRNVVCVGDEITFEDKSFFNIAGREWSFEGGFPAQSSSANPTITYNIPGTYEVTLKVTDGVDTVSTTEQALIRVLPEGESMPFEESFEFSNSLESENWTVATNGAYGWELTNDAAYTGSKALKMENYNNNFESRYEAISPSYDLSNLQSGELSFRYAYAPRTTNSNDLLRVYFSSNCGESWSLRAVLGAQTLNTTSGSSPAPFVPTQDEWGLQTIAIANNLLTEDFRVLFALQPEEGNDLYIDNINISGVFSEIPVLKSPTNGQGALPNALTLDWKATGQVINYEIQIDTSNQFNSPELQAGARTWQNYDHNLPDTEFDLQTLTNGETYFWRVRTLNANGYNPWSSVWSFSVSENGVGMNELGAFADQMKAYPNPTSQQVFVQLNMNTSENVVLEVIDLMGAQVHQSNWSTTVGTNRVSIPVNDWAKGIYLIRASHDGYVTQQKLIVQ